MITVTTTAIQPYVTCTRRLTFSAGHRVYGHESKCAEPHGHNYVVEVTAQAAKLDDVGRVIDFAVLKEKVGGWLDENWDHGFLLSVMDPMASVWPGVVGGKLWLGPNPTAENLAAHLLLMVCPSVLAGTGVTVVKIKLWETENCFAEAILVEKTSVQQS